MTPTPRINFKALTQFFMLSVGLMLMSAGASSNERPPNIVLLIGDDHGYPYFGFMGDEHVVTPSMDALAEGGVTFSHTHVTAPYCRPSLRTLATGLHPVDYQNASTTSSPDGKRKTLPLKLSRVSSVSFG